MCRFQRNVGLVVIPATLHWEGRRLVWHVVMARSASQNLKKLLACTYPRGSRYLIIKKSRLEDQNYYGFLGPNSLIMRYLDPLVFSAHLFWAWYQGIRVWRWDFQVEQRRVKAVTSQQGISYYSYICILYIYICIYIQHK